jgi:pseudouridine kinase
MDSFNEERHVLVIGSAGIDVKGRPDYGVTPGISTPGRIRSSMGGVARNIAENLARLEVPTWLLSAVGTDSSGEHILTSSSEAGIHMERVLSVPEARTGHYMALLTPEGELDTAVSDYAITEHITPAYLEDNADLFEMASLVVIDANLSAETLRTVFALAGKHDVPVCADPTAPSLANRLRPYLNRIHLITPNLAEADVLCEQAVTERDADAAIAVAQTLVERGVRIAVITLGVRGLVYVSGSDRGQIPAIRTEIRDETGAGDALTAGVIFGMVNQVPLDEAMRLGISAATLTLRSRETVVKELSQELLYDQLVI